MKKVWIHVILVAILAGCEKDKIQDIDCEKFTSGVLNMDEALVKVEIEKLTADLSPIVLPEDPIGHMANMKTLIDRLNDNCDNYTASLQCYACIETFPAQSEILIELSGGQHVIIDMHTPENDILRFARLHQ